MKIAVYTSCSLNYLPKARALAESLAEAEPGASLTLCLNDAVPGWLDLDAEPFDRVWLPEDLGYDRGWVFQHNVMELCTAVKGRALVIYWSYDAGPEEVDANGGTSIRGLLSVVTHFFSRTRWERMFRPIH